ncbi:MAG: hypothetical protein N4A61_04025 [Pelagimonas sp.]|jgi:hypothetical protein|nr:hypothetical protein [Pelagimonas sp.]
MMNFRWAAPYALAISCGVMAAPVQAQSGLGFNTLELNLSYSGSEFPVAAIDGRADFAITGAHGLQFDLGLTDYEWGQMGYFAAHLYLMPNTRMTRRCMSA